MCNIYIGPTVKERLVGIRLFFYQYAAIMIKRFQYSRRKPVAFLVQNVLPLFVIGFCLIIAHILLAVSNPPSLLLQPSMFFGVSPYNYVIVGNNATGASHNFIDTLYQRCGLGAKLLESPFDNTSSCYWKLPIDNCTDYPNYYDDLTCHDNCNCTQRAPPPPYPTCFNGTAVSNIYIITYIMTCHIY